MSVWLVSEAADAGTTPHYEFAHLGLREGQDFAQVVSIAQDPKGFMWFGTPQGLYRFDGYDSLEIQPGANLLSHMSVWALHSDSEGNLWIGTDGGLDVLDDATGKIRKVVLSRGSLLSPVVHSVFESSKKRLYIGTSQGLYERKSSGDFEAIDLGLPTYDVVVRAIAEGPNGYVWVATESNGIYRQSDNGFVRFMVDQTTFQGEYLRDITFDDGGALWVATFENGVFRINEVEEVIRVSSKELPRKVRSLFVDNDGVVWIGTSDGLFLYTGGEIKPAEGVWSDNRGTDVYQVFQDQSGVVWAGDYHGVSRYSLYQNRFEEIPFSTASDLSVVSAVEPLSDQSVLVGTFSGLGVWEEHSEVIQPYFTADGSKISTRITSILEIDADHLWLGTFDEGILVLENGLVTRRFRSLVSDETTVGANAITDMLIDSANTVWVSTYGGGVSKYRSESESFERYPDRGNPAGDFSDLRCLDILEGGDGNLWVATDGGGIVLLDPKTGETEIISQASHADLVSDNIVNLLATREGVWIGSLDQGVSYFDLASRTLSRFDQGNGLARNEVFGIGEDANGNVWVSHPRGRLSAFEQAEKKWFTFDSSHGIQPDLTQNADTNFGDVVVFGGAEGLTLATNANVFRNSYIPPIVPTEFRLQGKALPLRSMLTEGELQLDAHRNFFAFNFAALDYTYPERNQYRYKLEGFDRDWIDNGTDRSITYTNLDPGSYVLRVQGSNNDGVFNTEGYSLPIRILPPLWATWWAYTFYALGALYLFYLALRFSARREEKEAEARFHQRLITYVESLDETSECVLNADENGRIFFMNNAIMSVLGRPPSRVLGHNIFDMLFQKETDRVEAMVALEQHGAHHVEVDYVTEEALQKVIEVNLNAARPIEGDDLRYVSTTRDITEKALQQQAVARYTAELESQLERLGSELQGARDEFLKTERESLSLRTDSEARLRWLHDRINDNLQMLSSLMSIQASKSGDPETASILSESQERVRVLSLVHEQLQGAPFTSHVKMHEYLDSLVNGLVRSHRPEGVNVQLHTRGGDVELGLDQAVPCGMITNELVSNSLSHGYTDRTYGTANIRVDLSLSGGQVVLVVADDGKGLPLEITRNPGQSLGMDIVSTLTRQLGGELALVGGIGTTFEVRFPLSIEPEG